jgi:hypothetical protein
MTLDADKARGAVTTQNHIVLKMLIVSISLAAFVLTLIATGQ